MTPLSASDMIARLQGEIHERMDDLVPSGPIAIVDFPDIRNVGDSAIWLGEIAYLRSLGRTPAYVSRIHDFSEADLAAAVPEGPVFIHGGGNFGDIWVAHQNFRERLMERLPDRVIIQFPQSIHFASQARADEAARAIGRHGRFVLLVRDEESYAFATRQFDCEVRLCPDMAFCIGGVRPAATPRVDVLAMLREDKEKTGAHDLTALGDVPVEDWISESAASVRVAKAIGGLRATATSATGGRKLGMLQAAAENRFRRGVRQLSQGRAIVTDRLHVHIVSLLLGKPHAVLDNSYGKIGRFMAAFSGNNDLSYRASSLADGVRWARERAGTAR